MMNFDGARDAGRKIKRGFWLFEAVAKFFFEALLTVGGLAVVIDPRDPYYEGGGALSNKGRFFGQTVKPIK